MIVYTDEQGTAAWKKSRAGVITASMVVVARQRVGLLTEQQSKYVAVIRQGGSEAQAAEAAEYKSKPKPTETMQRAINGLPIGDLSDAAKKYAFRLAVERISGEPLDEGFETWQMLRGRELEPEARAEHEAQSGLLVEQAGFVTTDDGVFGATADGFIGSKGGCEYKCLTSPETIREVLLFDDISAYTDQIQTCMWIAGREWWHFGMYCPALKSIGLQLYWREIPRDDNYIEAMELDLMVFKRKVDEYEALLRERGRTAANDAGTILKAVS